MPNWITKDAQADRGIDVARDLGPVLEVSERVAIGSFFLFFHATLITTLL
jgi:hypothetical protein